RLALEASPQLAAVAYTGFVGRLEPAAREHGVQVTGVDARFFRMLGLSPIIGGPLSADDEVDPSGGNDGPAPVVLGHALWQRAFGGRSDVLGPQTLLGHSVRVVAVMGPGVKFPGETQVWIPIRQPRDRPAPYARLVPGAASDGLNHSIPE